MKKQKGAGLFLNEALWRGIWVGWDAGAEKQRPDISTPEIYHGEIQQEDFPPS